MIQQGIQGIISSTKSKKGSNVSATITHNTITDQTEIAENFNDFFTSIGANLEKKIPPTKKTLQII